MYSDLFFGLLLFVVLPTAAGLALFLLGRKVALWYFRINETIHTLNTLVEYQHQSLVALRESLRILAKIEQGNRNRISQPARPIGGHHASPPH